MIKPQAIPRDEFPRSSSSSQGMISLQPAADNYELLHYRDLCYGERAGNSLHLQLILPGWDAGKPPLVVYVTGSAFHKQDVAMTLPRLAYLANYGFAVASVEYTPSEVCPFPAQMLDVRAAVGFLRSQAERYGYDTDRIFLMGDSSGGHTVLMAGLSDYGDDLGCGQVQGIIDFYGPVDITKMNDELSSQDHMAADSPEGFLIGQCPVPEHPERTAPTIVTNYITADRAIPPVLIFHGTNDELVSFGQSCLLHDALRRCGKETAFYAMEGSHHGGREFWSSQVLDIVAEFVRTGSLSPAR